MITVHTKNTNGWLQFSLKQEVENTKIKQGKSWEICEIFKIFTKNEAKEL